MRRLGLSLALLLVVAACGSDGSDATSIFESTDPGTDSRPTPIDVADAVVVALGPAGGFATVLYALDAGYSTAQITRAALAGDLDRGGDIADVDPDGLPYGLIATPEEGTAWTPDVTAVHIAYRVSGPAALGDENARSPDKVYGEFNSRMRVLGSIQLLGEPFGVSADISYDDVFPSPSEADDPGPVASPEGAQIMIGVLLGLMDVGYTFDQALNGFLFGDWQMAIGLDKTGESFTGAEVGGQAVSVCIVLRDEAGGLIQPDAAGTNTFFGSATCRNAIREGTISFEGLDELRVLAESDGKGDSDDDQTTGEDSRALPPLLFMGTFTNTGSVEFKFESDAEERPQKVTCVQTGDAALTIFSDGRVAATLIYTEIVDYKGGCRTRAEPLVAEPVGTAEDGVVRLGICGTVLEGPYDDDSLFGSVACVPVETESAISRAEIQLDLFLAEPSP